MSRFQQQSLGLTIALLLAAASPASAEARDSRRPNVIVILTDDQGFADLGCYGSRTIKTPAIDRLAAEGVRCTSYYAAAPICTPTRAALMTGCYARRVGLSTPLHVYDRVGLNPNETTLPEALKKLGYITGCIGKWHLGHEPPHYPTQHGFDFYSGSPLGHMFNRPVTDRTRGDVSDLFLHNNKRVAWVRPEELTEQTTNEAVAFITRHRQTPFFLFVSHCMPHEPLHVDEVSKGRSQGGLYGDVIECIDDSVAAIRDAIEVHDLANDTIILFTSDNGPKKGDGSAAPYRGFKHDPYEGGVRVPLVAWGPGRLATAKTCSEMVATMDLYPSIVALCGGQCDPRQTFDGLDLSHLFAASPRKSTRRNEFFYFVRHGVLVGVRVGNWKLLIRPRKRHATPQEAAQRLPAELYQLENDAGEENNVAAEHPDIVSRLKNRMAAFRLAMDRNARPPAGSYRALR